MTPGEYAARYLPIQVPGPAEALPINVERYHNGAPTAAQQALWSALGDHFRVNQKRNSGYRLRLIVNRMPLEIASREEIRMSAVRPFWGKGSPEDCQVVLQLATLLRLTTPERLQAWTNANLGLDCNGFVGNYLFHVVLKADWLANAGKKQPGPSSLITSLFKWAAGEKEENALDDLSKLDAQRIHILAKVDDDGKVMPGGPGNPHGHIAITEPGQFMKQSFVSNSMGGLDLKTALQGMYNKPAVRTVESAGPVKGVGQNWLVFTEQLTPKTVFEVRRDNIRKASRMKIAPIP